MAAPTLQAEGALAVATTGDLTTVLPAHQADDVFVLASGLWAPNSSDVPLIAAPAGWTELAQLHTGSSLDGKLTWHWKRAASGAESNPTLVRPTGADTGADTCWGGRAYVIRGCVTSGNPWDEVDATPFRTTSNQPVDSLTVLGQNRLAIHFLVYTDDLADTPSISGWTAGTLVSSTTGTNHAECSFRKDDVSATTAAASPTLLPAAGAGGYAFLGVSFKPPPVLATDTSGVYDDGGVVIEADVTYDTLTNFITAVDTRNNDTKNWKITIDPALEAPWVITSAAGQNEQFTNTPISPYSGAIDVQIQFEPL
jgi:hypothetical protein